MKTIKTEEPILKILHLEDMATDAELTASLLRKSQLACEICVVSNRAAFIRELIAFKPDLILSDHTLPGFNSLEALFVMQQSGRKIPFILLTGTVSEQFAIKAMNEGVADYILKDRPQRLPEAIRSAVEKFRLAREHERYVEELIAKKAMMKEAEHLAKAGSWQVEWPKGESIWSDETFRLLGYKPGEIRPDYETFMSHVHPEDVELLKEHFTRVVSGGAPAQTVRHRMKDKSGTVKIIRSVFALTSARITSPLQITGSSQDVSEF